ncbi:hypothetical protein ACFOZ1_06800 [Gracilibacillus marinus]|uniref:Uncharacterized protein n=1 Tax=Gracilibacillus marinus TaxID=630535 RepID=A0ABV8VWQ8_9BACI
MKFILCQPAINRFKWELEVCITRLKKLGIDDIVLLFAQEDNSIPLYFSEMYEVEVHVYDDRERDKTYIPSVKPFLWMKYLEEDRSREEESYFYLDSDVLLREIPKVRPTKKTWYASDCTSYISNDYIDSKGDTLLEDMCNKIGIDYDLIRKSNPIGGAQWVIKQPTFEYWKKVYEDSLKLYRYLSDIEAEYIQNNDKDYMPIQKWTAEMWAQLWNVYHFGINVKVPSELDFSWPNHDRTSYYEKKLFHNAGVTTHDKDLFFKGQYVNKSPFYDDLSHVNPEKASYEYVLAIKEVTNMVKYIALETFRDLEDDKIYEKDKPFPRPANKKISKERIEALSTNKNQANRPLIKKVEG